MTLPRITLSAERHPNPLAAPPWPDNGPPWSGTAWLCTLTCEGRTMTVPYFMGPALTGAPKVGDVLDCLTSDAQYVDDPADLDDITAGMPYSKARKVADAITEQADELRALLGDAFDAYVHRGPASGSGWEGDER